MRTQNKKDKVERKVRELLEYANRVSGVLHDTVLLAAAELSKDGHLAKPTIDQIDQAIRSAWAEAVDPGNFSSIDETLQVLAQLLQHADARKHLAQEAKELGYDEMVS